MSTEIFTGERITGGMAKGDIPTWIDLARKYGLKDLKGKYKTTLEHLARVKFVANEFNINGLSVLDIACGSGYASSYLLPHAPKQYVGADIDIASVHDASHNFSGDFIAGDAQELAFANNSFNLVISFETIEHLEHPEKYLSEVSRVLVQPGKFVVSTPNRKVSNPGTTITTTPKNPFHIREYNQEEFQNLLKQYFPQVEMYGQFTEGRGSTENHEEGHLSSRGGMMLSKLKQLVMLPHNSRVIPLRESEEPSYFVAVCSNVDKKITKL